MEQPKTKVLLPTYKVNQLIKHLGLGTLKVQAIKDMGFQPVYEIECSEKGKGGYYWDTSIVNEIEIYVNNNRVKLPNIQVSKKDFYALAQLIGDDINTIKAMLEDLTKTVKETQQNQYDLLTVWQKDSKALDSLIKEFKDPKIKSLLLKKE